MVKNKKEIILIRKSCQITLKSLNFIKALLKPGRTEKQISWILEQHLRENGADELAFPIIVAAGSHSVVPHHKTTNRKIKKDDLVLIDVGIKINGYCSDFTRTYFVGKPKPEWIKIYKIVNDAQKTTMTEIGKRKTEKEKLTAKEIDEICRNYIAKHGYGKYFIHGTGHGLGLKVHEPPKIGPKNKTKMASGMVITIEPGIYLPGKFGVRIEDVFLYQSGILKTLSGLSAP